MTALTEEVPSRRSRRRLIVVGAVVAIGAIAVAVTQLGGGSPNPQAAARSATTVSVVTTDVAETTPVNGTVGFASPSSVVEPAGVAASALTKDQQAVAAAAQNLAADRQAQADAAGADAQSASQAQQAIATAQATLAADTTQLHDDQAALAAAQQKQANDCQGTDAAQLRRRRRVEPVLGGFDRRLRRPEGGGRGSAEGHGRPGRGAERPGAGRLRSTEGRAGG